MPSDEDGDFDSRPEPSIWMNVSSRQIQPSVDRAIRHASVEVNRGGGHMALMRDGQVVLRDSERSKTKIKATFVEVDRGVKSLELEQIDKSHPENRQRVALNKNEIVLLEDFLKKIREEDLRAPGIRHIEMGGREDTITLSQVQEFARRDPETLARILSSVDLTRDVVAVEYRRTQLKKFERMLESQDAFDEERRALEARPEEVWQRFFEKNTWIFGYGLSYLFLSNLDGRSLELAVRGASIFSAGKRPDAVMKTSGLVNSFCFVEIKRHDTPLLETARHYRGDSWQPSKELTGAVSQMHASVQATIEDVKGSVDLHGPNGDPTGEVLFNFSPRSFIVIGSLSQFQAEHGINTKKFRSFELYRRHMQRPEILTFDEILSRARFIVEHPS